MPLSSSDTDNSVNCFLLQGVKMLMSFPSGGADRMKITTRQCDTSYSVTPDYCTAKQLASIFLMDE